MHGLTERDFGNFEASRRGHILGTVARNLLTARPSIYLRRSILLSW